MKKLLLVLLVVVFLLSACNKQVYRMDYDKELLMEQAKTDCASIPVSYTHLDVYKRQL